MPLHPFIADLFDKLAQAGKPALSAGSPNDARALTRTSRAVLSQGPEMLRVEELTVPTRSGHIAARLYVPAESVVGLIVYVHGGGWVLGEPDEAYARALADAGASVTTRRIDGLPHGFIRMHNLVDTADVALSAIAMDIATLCALPPVTANR